MSQPMITATLDDAKERIRKLAEERPDYVYEPISFDGSTRCVYFTPEGEPSCIVGQAYAEELRAAGVNFDTALPAYTLFGGEQRAREFLSDVQELQDTGNPWGESYHQALARSGG